MSAPLSPGSIFAGDFRVVRPLAAGGMGSLYVVEQISTGQSRALKVMHPQLVGSEELRRRFEQEARVGARIESEHVVHVVAAGVDGASGMPYLVMELLEGEDLAAYVERRGAMPQAEVADVFEELCHAVGAAHAAGIVHRDLKPENVFLARTRRAGARFTVKVLDFGIAKLVAEGAGAKSTGAMGSPMWLAPEQTERGAITPAADVWALGLMAFHLLTGAPFWRSATGGETTVAQLLREVLFEPIPAASERARERGRTVPAGFDAFFARAVARAPKERFHDARALGDALVPLLRGSSAVGAATAQWAPSPAPGHSLGFAATLPASAAHAPRVAAPASPAVSGPAHVGPTPPGLAVTASRRSGSGLVAVLAVLGILFVGGAGVLALVLRSSLSKARVSYSSTDVAPTSPAIAPTPTPIEAPTEAPHVDAGAGDGTPVLGARDAAIAAWIAGPLLGNDNGMAAFRGARITNASHGDESYTLTIDNQFKFTCELEFDDAGTPKTLRDCVSGDKGGWSASPKTIPVRCSRANGRETCVGAYRLLNVGVNMDDPAALTFSRPLGDAGAPHGLGPKVTPHAPPAPTPTAPPPGTGHLPPLVIQRVMAAARPRFRACYEQGLAKDPTLGGRVPLRFTVAPDGSVTSATVASGGTLHDAGVEACMLGVTRSLSFPAPEGGGAVSVSYPVIFQSADRPSTGTGL